MTTDIPQISVSFVQVPEALPKAEIVPRRTSFEEYLCGRAAHLTATPLTRLIPKWRRACLLSPCRDVPELVVIPVHVLFLLPLDILGECIGNFRSIFTVSL